VADGVVEVDLEALLEVEEEAEVHPAGVRLYCNTALLLIE
jgi:hypothetical protein